MLTGRRTGDAVHYLFLKSFYNLIIFFTMITDKCPNCGCIWGIEEMDWNKCFACGYPDNEDDNDDWDDSGVFDEDDDSDDPNDSRNL